MNLKRIIAGLGLLLLSSSATFAANCSSNPYTLQNGQTADASQVMANFNNLLTCANNNLAHSGANADINSLSALTTPITPSQGGSAEFLGGTSTGSANAQLIATTPTTFALTTGYRVTFIAGFSNTAATQVNVNSTGLVTVDLRTSGGLVALVANDIVIGQVYTLEYDGTEFQLLSPSAAIGPTSSTAGHVATFAGTDGTHLSDGGTMPVLHQQYFSTTGTFTPSPAGLATTTFEVILTAAGGGGGGGGVGGDGGGGGAASGTAYYYFTGTGCNAGCAVTLPGQASGGLAGANGGNAGGNATIVVGATTVTASGGGGGNGGQVPGGTGSLGGRGGTTTNATIPFPGGDGEAGAAGLANGSAAYTGPIGGTGGGTVWGTGGRAGNSGNPGADGQPCGSGGGGGGPTIGTPEAGGKGQAGCALIRWVQ